MISSVGGVQKRQFGVPNATFSTSGNDMYFLVDVWFQKLPKGTPFGFHFCSFVVICVFFSDCINSEFNVSTFGEKIFLPLF